MGVKENLLALLNEKNGEYISGETAASSLGVSRTAIWKAIKTLQTQGYQIDAVTNKGYCLAKNTDVITSESVAFYTKNKDVRIEVVPTIDSTNNAVKKRASEGEEQGLILIAKEQSLGKGRLGRSFYSPSDCGIYMSFLLKPTISATDAQLITTAAAVAVAKAIETVCGQYAQIKWVNDLFINNKKICGILTEASFNMENGALDWAVLGIGINAYAPPQGYPSELAQIVGSVLQTPQKDFRSKLAAYIIDEFMQLYKTLASKAYLEEYRSRSLVIGKRINIVKNNTHTPALATGIDDNCHLLVQYDDGTNDVLSTGEISIRLV